MNNIVVVVIDGVRAKNLSLYGYNKETDKNLKKLASEGIFFKNHFSPSNSTAPSLISLFTGKYPDNHGIVHQFPYTKQEEIEKFKKTEFWFPSYLKKKGYNTIGIDWSGLWFKKGFDYYGDEENKTRKILNSPIIKKILLSLPNWVYKFGKKLTKIRSSPQIPPAHKTTDLAISKIKESKKPFFLFLHYLDTHFPFPTVKNPKPSGERDIYKILENIKDKSQKEYIKKRIVDISLNSIKDIVNKYDLVIETLDFEIGRLVNFLKKENLWGNTIFIVLADHGENFGEHGIYFSHAGLYDESIHVPLIIKIPGFKNKEVDGMMQNIDIIPTILDFSGEKSKIKKYNFDGFSLLSFIKDKKKEIRKKVLSFDGLAEDIKAVRSKNRKWITAKNSRCNLCKSSHHLEFEEYDLKKDPQELKNIYSKK